VGTGALPDGYATDAGAELVYRGTELVEAICDRPHAGAYRITPEPQADAQLPQRRALTARDQGSVTPRCAAPVDAYHAHHATWRAHNSWGGSRR
jgi:hypothetical protein